jgi:uncharacterized protein YjbI with pentapeptide repeats
VGANFSGASLAYHNLQGRDLHDATFGQAVINGTDFSGANLTNTYYGGGANTCSSGVTTPTATLTVFQNANLTNATIAGAFQVSANFNGANLTGAHLYGHMQNSCDSLNMSGSTFQGANFHNATFSTLDTFPEAPQAVMYGGDFAGALFDGTTINIVFMQSAFPNVDFRTALIQPKSGFRGANLTGANFSNLTLDQVHFIAQGENPAVPANVTGANFSGVHFLNANLGGTDFSTVNLTGATWTATTCPDYTNSDDNGGTCIGHLVP